jgi:hypothetical protein
MFVVIGRHGCHETGNRCGACDHDVPGEAGQQAY